MKEKHATELKKAIDETIKRTKEERSSWPSDSVEFKAYTCSIMSLLNLKLSLIEIQE